jgi:Fur family ferric uptake transcriptional regulator
MATEAEVTAGSHPYPAGRANRSTRQGAAVLRALKAADGFRSAQDIHADLRSAGESVGLTTVYRHLQMLTDDEVIDALQTADGEVVYRECESAHHHHHVVCRNCGKSVEIDEPAVERWAARVAEESGFTDISHTVEIFGLCARCAPGR